MCPSLSWVPVSEKLSENLINMQCFREILIHAEKIPAIVYFSNCTDQTRWSIWWNVTYGQVWKKSYAEANPLLNLFLSKRNTKKYIGFSLEFKLFTDRWLFVICRIPRRVELELQQLFFLFNLIMWQINGKCSLRIVEIIQKKMQNSPYPHLQNKITFLRTNLILNPLRFSLSYTVVCNKAGNSSTHVQWVLCLHSIEKSGVRVKTEIERENNDNGE